MEWVQEPPASSENLWYPEGMMVESGHETEVFRIHDMNTLYKIGDLNTMANSLCKCGACLAMGRTCPDLSGRTSPHRLFLNIT